MGGFVDLMIARFSGGGDCVARQPAGLPPAGVSISGSARSAARQASQLGQELGGARAAGSPDGGTGPGSG